MNDWLQFRLDYWTPCSISSSEIISKSPHSPPQPQYLMPSSPSHLHPTLHIHIPQPTTEIISHMDALNRLPLFWPQAGISPWKSILLFATICKAPSPSLFLILKSAWFSANQGKWDWYLPAARYKSRGVMPLVVTWVIEPPKARNRFINVYGRQSSGVWEWRLRDRWCNAVSDCRSGSRRSAPPSFMKVSIISLT